MVKRNPKISRFIYILFLINFLFCFPIIFACIFNSVCSEAIEILDFDYMVRVVFYFSIIPSVLLAFANILYFDNRFIVYEDKIVLKRYFRKSKDIFLKDVSIEKRGTLIFIVTEKETICLYSSDKAEKLLLKKY